MNTIREGISCGRINGKNGREVMLDIRQRCEGHTGRVQVGKKRSVSCTVIAISEGARVENVEAVRWKRGENEDKSGETITIAPYR